jgi:hypothetical protein
VTPAIVLPVFARPASLERLLASLVAADVPSGVPLVFVVDRAADEKHRCGNSAVAEIVHRFQWPYGPKNIIVQPQPMGLVSNIFFAGGLAKQYGAIILLEDDLIVSTRFFDYACQALHFYREETRIAGLSLNSLWFNGFTGQPFIPLLDDGDVFFLRLSTPQGQVYTAEQWAAFDQWMASNDFEVTAADDVHELFTTFPADDWLAIKAKYLAATEKFYVYPRESLTTNFGEPGTHFKKATALFQVPLQNYRASFRFQSLDNAIAVYDGYYELLPDRLNRQTGVLTELEYDVDLYATKAVRHLKAPYLLTTRPAKDPLTSFARIMRPMEANVIAGLPGNNIFLAPRANVDFSSRATLVARRQNDSYFARRNSSEGGLGRMFAEHILRTIGRRD